MARRFREITHLDPKHVAAFWERVDRRGDDECWPWKLSLTPKGYGQYSVATPGGEMRNYIASRYSFATISGDPGQFMVLHSCDNRTCCNPNHLRLGTVLENAQDMKDRNRQNRGSARPLSKLTEEQVIMLSKLWESGNYSQQDLATLFKVNQSQVSRAVNRKRWKHVA